MIPARKKDLVTTSAVSALAASLCLYICHLGYATAAGRALFADGSFFFVSILNDTSLWPSFHDDKVNRLLSCLLNELPLSVGLLLGVRELAALRLLFGLGCFFVPFCIMSFAVHVALRGSNSWLPILIILAYVIGFLPSEIFIINPAFTAMGTMFVLTAYTLSACLPRRLDWCIAAIFGIISLGAHDGAVITGPMLAALGFLVLRKSPALKATEELRRFRWMIVAFALAATGYAAFRLATQPSSPEAGQYGFQALLQLLDPQLLLLGNMGITVCISIAMLVIGGAALCFPDRRRLPPVLLVLTALGGAGATGAGAHLLVSAGVASPGLEYQYRCLVIFSTAAALFFLFLTEIFDFQLGRVYRNLLIGLAAAGLFGQTLWQFGNDTQWDNFVTLTRREAAEAQHPVIDPNDIVELTLPNDPALRYGWGWTWPAFGMALQTSPDVEKIFAPQIEQAHMHIPGGDADELTIPYARLRGRILHFKTLNQDCVKVACPFMTDASP